MWKYYRLDFGAVVKIRKEDFSCFRIDPRSQEWVEDSSLYSEIAYGSYNYKEITLSEAFYPQNGADSAS